MTKEQMIEVLEAVAKDVKNDAESFDGKPFNGRTVAANQYVECLTSPFSAYTIAAPRLRRMITVGNIFSMFCLISSSCNVQVHCCIPST